MVSPERKSDITPPSTHRKKKARDQRAHLSVCAHAAWRFDAGWGNRNRAEINGSLVQATMCRLHVFSCDRMELIHP